MSQNILEELGARLYCGDAPAVVALLRQGLGEGLAAALLLEQGLLPGMGRVGQDFKAGELFIPEIIVAARAMHAGIEELRPLLAGSAAGRSAGKLVIGTVKGDLHDIGKKLVAVMFQGAGFEVIDLGHDVAPERFVEAVREHRPELLGLSALLSTTMPMMKSTIAALEQAGLGATRILVGGAPVTRAFAAQIGAHGYAADAVSAVEQGRALLQGQDHARA